MICSIRAMGVEDLERTLSWRNHPDISRYMLTQHLITPDEHQQWFERASKDLGRRLLIVEDNDLALGFVQFSEVVSGGVSDWGFYLAPEAPKGSGSRLGVSALSFAFVKLGLKKVCGRALDMNTASVAFHRKRGFQQEGVLRGQHRIGNTYHDLICFGLLDYEWRSGEGQEIEKLS